MGEVLDRFDYLNFHELYKDFDNIDQGYDICEAKNPKVMYTIYSEDQIAEYGVVW